MKKLLNLLYNGLQYDILAVLIKKNREIDFNIVPIYPNRCFVQGIQMNLAGALRSIRQGTQRSAAQRSSARILLVTQSVTQSATQSATQSVTQSVRHTVSHSIRRDAVAQGVAFPTPRDVSYHVRTC